MTKIAIRKARPDDITAIVEFQRRLANESENLTLDQAIVRKGVQAIFDDPTKGAYFVAEIDGSISGCHSITYEWSDWRNGTVWWIQSVYVVEKYRKHGVFKAMFHNLQTLIANDASVMGLRLYVDKSNVRAQKAYEAIGMNGEHYSTFEWMKR
jgi:ribosomal protein S18 acetylase RimI-like enzyme